MRVISIDQSRFTFEPVFAKTVRAINRLFVDFILVRVLLCSWHEDRGIMSKS
uniref:Uncharacterized protein n=1 Tax=Helianthus annuus TaxID=4232 RepID=A0A251SPQ4_HELAN